jgi:hypothetical protein
MLKLLVHPITITNTILITENKSRMSTLTDIQCYSYWSIKNKKQQQQQQQQKHEHSGLSKYLLPVSDCRPVTKET